jgi:hypothetical protein
VRLDVDEEGDLDAREQRPFDRAEQKQRKPDDPADDEHAALDVRLGVGVADSRAQQELIERPAEDERKAAELGDGVA